LGKIENWLKGSSFSGLVDLSLLIVKERREEMQDAVLLFDNFELRRRVRGC
jgi:hypothetical protein